MTDDFFHSRLKQMIDNNHPLAVLVSRLPWEKTEAGVAPQFSHKDRALQQSEDAPDLAAPVVRVSGGKASNAGRPRRTSNLARLFCKCFT
jgi:IS5 family transposase